jgi:DNA-binding MarR family transcriptional regulator
MRNGKTEQIVSGMCRDWVEAVTIRSMHDMTRYVRTTGFTMSQLSLLFFLKHGGECGVREIGSRLGITTPAASQLVDRLVRGGLADRTEDPKDRRNRRVRLSELGADSLRKTMRERFHWIDEMVGAMTAEELTAARAALPVLLTAEQRLPALEHHVPKGEI